MARYSRSAGKDVKSAMSRRKKGTLKSGKGGKGGKVKSRKQAIAIGLSEARKKGKKVPRRKTARKRSLSPGARSTTSRRGKKSASIPAANRFACRSHNRRARAAATRRRCREARMRTSKDRSPSAVRAG